MTLYRIAWMSCKLGRTDLGIGTSRFQITQEYYRTDIRLDAIGGKALGTSEGALS